MISRSTVHLALVASAVAVATAFSPTLSLSLSSTSLQTAKLQTLSAAPKRLEDNVDGPLYVNEKCINCAACAMFAPSVFERRERDGAHVVYHQPASETEIETARAALSACPVAAIRVETQAHRHHRDQDALSETEESLTKELAINPKFNGRAKPFPRAISESFPHVYHLGHHNEASFGAAPYLIPTKTDEGQEWVMIDTPKFSKSSQAAVESLTGSSGPAFLVLTHVDDTADHQKWKEAYPELKRVFHAGDLGRHNWIGDKSLETVEILLPRPTNEQADLQYYDLRTGKQVTGPDGTADLVLVHTPGHSPGSITLWQPPSSSNNGNGVLFTGDTYAYSTRDGGHMSGFPRYGNDRKQQAQTLRHLYERLDWQVVVPGHGHVRDYTASPESSDSSADKDIRWVEMQEAIQELERW